MDAQLRRGQPALLAATTATFLGWRSAQPLPSYAEAQPLDLDRGGYVFRTRCVGCHTIGHGDLVGPDLAGVTDRRDGAWLARYLAEPDRVLAAGDPIAAALFAKYHQIPMPNLRLDREDVAALVAYLETQRPPPDGPVQPQLLATPYWLPHRCNSCGRPRPRPINPKEHGPMRRAFGRAG